MCALHPEGHRTRGFSTELWCSSPEGISRAALWDMEPQHSHSCPAITQYTHTHICVCKHPPWGERGIFTLWHSHSSFSDFRPMFVAPWSLSITHTCIYSNALHIYLFHVQKYTFLILSSHIFYIRYNSLTRKKVNYCTIWSNHSQSNCSCNMRSTFSVLFWLGVFLLKPNCASNYEDLKEKKRII